jgi:hypothetical protein
VRLVYRETDENFPGGLKEEPQRFLLDKSPSESWKDN